MAFIAYASRDGIPIADQVADDDNILKVHAIHSRVMKLHYDLYIELMHKQGPVSREQREMIAVMVSTANECHY
jgi:predicted regulator of Ras-like GTPase activity (Roadblock/LC7/MglB family)